MQIDGLFFMQRLIYFLLLKTLLLFGGCVSSPSSPSSQQEGQFRPAPLPKYSILVRDAVHHTDGFVGLPRLVYVFPPLLMDGNFRPLGELFPRNGPAGALFWSSSAPVAGEIQATVSQAMESCGHRAITFDQLSFAKRDHAVTVLNLYFSEPRAEKKDKQPTGRWLASLRLTGSSYPASLDPKGKRDLLQAEALIVFSAREQYQDALKRSFRALVGRLQANGNKTQTMSLLD